MVLEKGSRTGESVAQWGHVRVFSPWKYNVDKAAVSLLDKAGWQAPDPEKLPLGSEILRDYLEPLARVTELHSRIHLGANVLSVARVGFDKMKSEGREDAPFLVVYEEGGQPKELLASAVIDASGTYTEPIHWEQAALRHWEKTLSNPVSSTESLMLQVATEPAIPASALLS